MSILPSNSNSFLLAKNFLSILQGPIFSPLTYYIPPSEIYISLDIPKTNPQLQIILLSFSNLLLF